MPNASTSPSRAAAIKSESEVPKNSDPKAFELHACNHIVSKPHRNERPNSTLLADRHHKALIPKLGPGHKRFSCVRSLGTVLLTVHARSVGGESSPARGYQPASLGCEAPRRPRWQCARPSRADARCGSATHRCAGHGPRSRAGLHTRKCAARRLVEHCS